MIIKILDQLVKIDVWPSSKKGESWLTKHYHHYPTGLYTHPNEKNLEIRYILNVIKTFEGYEHKNVKVLEQGIHHLCNLIYATSCSAHYQPSQDQKT